MKIDHLTPLVIVVALVGCKDKDAPQSTGPTSSTVANPSKPATGLGTDGGGDRSGTSVANARALLKGTPVALKLDCKQTVFFGPFQMAKDPETLTIKSTSKTPSGAQVCIGSEFHDPKGAHVGGGAMGCVDSAHAGTGAATYEYSPGNGGAGANPVYLSVKFADPKPEGCPSVDLTLSL